MYTLYYSPGACSMAVHVLLNELGQAVTLENAGKPRSAEFLKINPRGTVPVLVDDGFIIREGAAILLHLLEKHKSPLLPPAGKERAAALEWLMFCNATLHPAYARIFGTLRTTTGEMQEFLLAKALEVVNKHWQDVEAQLTQHPYLCGNDCTIADILLAVIANWSAMVPLSIQIGPKTRALLQKVISRPAYKKALEIEQIDYKMAA